MSYTKTLPPKVGRYYKRRRELQNESLDGTTSAVVTRYAWGEGKRIVKGPRGGKLYQRFYRQAYYNDGRFYKISKVNTGKGLWPRVFVPLDGRIWDCHPLQSEEQGIPAVAIDLKMGYPVAVTIDGERCQLNEESAETMLAVLGLEG